VALYSSRLKELLRMCWIFRDALTVLVERPQIAHGISTPGCGSFFVPLPEPGWFDPGGGRRSVSPAG
jgi:hypothetical protein